jgi:hypothetical protein
LPGWTGTVTLQESRIVADPGQGAHSPSGHVCFGREQPRQREADSDDAVARTNAALIQISGCWEPDWCPKQGKIVVRIASDDHGCGRFPACWLDGLEIQNVGPIVCRFTAWWLDVHCSAIGHNMLIRQEMAVLGDGETRAGAIEPAL